MSVDELLDEINFPTSYPDESPELLMLVNKDNLKYTDTTYLEKIVNSAISNTFVSGQVLMYELLTQLSELLDGYVEERVKVNGEEPATEEQENTPPPQTQPPVLEVEEVKDVTADWIKSDVIFDRRSSFIAYARAVESLEEAQMHIEELLQDKRVSKAAHNISSWRINDRENKRYQDCDDDGETAAGGRLLHLLQMMDVWNVVVVVSRYFGGIHLGPDRFKHINTAARDAITKGGYLLEKPKETGKSRKK